MDNLPIGEFCRDADSKHLAPVIARLASTRGHTGWEMTNGFEIDSMAMRHLLRAPGWVPRPVNYAMRALQTMAERQEVSLPAFAAAMTQQLETLRKEFQDKAAPCWMILPMRLPYSLEGETPRCIRMLGVDFGVMRIEDLREYLGGPDAAIDNDTRVALEHEKLPKTCVCVAANGFPIEIAFNQVGPAFDALRGAMELAMSFGTRQWHMGGWSRQGSVPHPKHLVCMREGLETWTLRFKAPDWEPWMERTEIAGRPKFLDRVERIAKLIPEAQDDTSTVSLIADLLRLYAQAMEEDRAHNCLLALWQMAESMTLDATDRGNGDRVVSRLGWFERFLIKKPTGALTIALRGVMHKRNEAVHRGMYGAIDSDDVNVLKLACDFALQWFIAQRDKLPTRRHLSIWWNHFQRPDAELQVIGDVCRHIGHERR